LNISVACAVSLYEALRQRLAGGLMGTPKISGEEHKTMFEDWIAR
jgi:tRNA (guanosine-2'-O-)-methyltransferase